MARGPERETPVREARAEDLCALQALYRHLHPGQEPAAEAEARQAWEAMLRDPKVHCFVAEADGRLAASCTLTVIPNLTYGARPYGLIENVVTHADCRRRGLGTAVLRHALRTAWRESCYKVMLFTGRDLKEVGPFYGQAGFQAGKKTAFVAFPPNGRG